MYIENMLVFNSGRNIEEKKWKSNDTDKEIAWMERGWRDEQTV